MGAWSFMDAILEWVLNNLGYFHRRARYAGRPASASTATGLLSQHIKEQTALVADALGT
jgi:2-oxoglutarate dehydrogenase E1 component